MCLSVFLPTPPPLLPSCLPISLFSIAGVWILLLGSRSPIRHYYRHRAPLGVLVLAWKNIQNVPFERFCSAYSAALGGCERTGAERKLLRAIGRLRTKGRERKRSGSQNWLCLSVVSVDGKKTRPGGNVAEHPPVSSAERAI